MYCTVRRYFRTIVGLHVYNVVQLGVAWYIRTEVLSYVLVLSYEGTSVHSYFRTMQETTVRAPQLPTPHLPVVVLSRTCTVAQCKWRPYAYAVHVRKYLSSTRAFVWYLRTKVHDYCTVQCLQCTFVHTEGPIHYVYVYVYTYSQGITFNTVFIWYDNKINNEYVYTYTTRVHVLYCK